MRHYEKEAPGLLKVLKDNYWHRSIGTQQKLVVIRTLMNRYEVKQWNAWGRANRIKLGLVVKPSTKDLLLKDLIVL